MILYLKNKKNSYNAVGEYDHANKSFVLKKGSIISDSVTYSATFRAADRIKHQRKGVINNNNKTIKDLTFKSSSTAANFVTGRSTNGLIAWKDENGKKLKELLKDE